MPDHLSSPYPYLPRTRSTFDPSTSLLTIWPGLPVSDEVRAYVPLDAAERLDTYERNTGLAATFPIPLTPCTK